MWFLNIIIISSFSLVTVTNAETTVMGAIGFPEVEENPLLINKENRTPVFFPAMCAENELYYPGDQKDDWICDCRPGYLYHPKTNKCWLAYRQGPCKNGQYLVLPQDSKLPICYVNPCRVDNIVMWRGQCEELGSTTPCGSSFPPYVLWVNATNVVLDCLSLTKVENIPGVTRTPPNVCLPGCKRSIQNKCVII